MSNIVFSAQAAQASPQETEEEWEEGIEATNVAPPWVTYLMLGTITLLFAIMWFLSQGRIETVTLAFGQKQNDLIREGQIWRLVTAAFLHGNLVHLLTNGLSLLWMGRQMEQIYGARKYFLVYMVAGIVGNLVSYLGSPVPSLGASGALFGLIGAGLVFPLRFRALVPEKARSQILSQLSGILLINLGLGFSVSHIDNWAHIGGLLGGGFAALWLLPEALEEKQPTKVQNLLLSTTCVLMLGVIAWAGISQWRWAMQETPKTQEFTMNPEGVDPWWSVQLPRRWKQVPEGWRSPEGAVLQIIDGAYRPHDLAQRLALLSSPSGLKADSLTLGEQPAFHFLKQTPQRWQEVYLLTAYQQGVAVSLDCPRQIYPKVAKDFLHILQSVHFRHAPLPPPSPSGEIPEDASPKETSPK